MFRQFITPLIVSIIIAALSTAHASSPKEEEIQGRATATLSTARVQPPVEEKPTTHTIAFHQSVTDNQHVTALSFKRQHDLTDLSFLKFFPALTYLCLEECPNVTNLLPVISQLTQLKHLRLRDMGLTSIEPLQFLVNLEALNLGGNYSIKRIEPITRLPRLQYLSLADCASILDLDLIGNMTQLQKLNLAAVFDCDVDGGSKYDYPPLDFLVPLTLLTHLSLATGCMIEDLSPIWKIKSLKVLSITGLEHAHCKFITSLPGVERLQSLEAIALGNVIYMMPPTYLRGLPNLKLVGFYENPFRENVSQYIPTGVQFGNVSLPGFDW